VLSIVPTSPLTEKTTLAPDTLFPKTSKHEAVKVSGLSDGQGHARGGQLDRCDRPGCDRDWDVHGQPEHDTVILPVPETAPAVKTAE